MFVWLMSLCDCIFPSEVLFGTNVSLIFQNKILIDTEENWFNSLHFLLYMSFKDFILFSMSASCGSVAS